VVKDLVPDLTLFYAQYDSIKPYLQTTTPSRRPMRSACRRRKTAPSWTAVRVHPVRLLLDVLPELLVEPTEFLGPAALLQAYRWIADSRDEATGERLDDLEDPFKLYRCHTIMNCAQVCPKGLNPAKAIARPRS
jgi:succinate dehydrogenase / fumarate reductase, iron-sulfur subunit